MDALKKVIKEKIIENIAEELGEEEEKQRHLSFKFIVEYAIDRWEKEKARNKELGVK